MKVDLLDQNDPSPVFDWLLTLSHHELYLLQKRFLNKYNRVNVSWTLAEQGYKPKGKCVKKHTFTLCALRNNLWELRINGMLAYRGNRDGLSVNPLCNRIMRLDGMDVLRIRLEAS